jgi:hypothetical protein
MPTIKLTQDSAKKLPTPTDGKAKTYFDEKLPGFGLRVSPQGRKTFIAVYRIKGDKQVWETIGTMAVIPSVEDARTRARTSIDKARQGINPVAVREQQEAAAKAEAEAKANTFAKVATRYIEEYADIRTKANSARETARLLRKASAYFGDKPIRDIKKADVIELISNRKPHHTGTRGLIEANQLLSAVRRACKWAKKKDIIEVDPTIDVDKPGDEQARDRVLTNDEIVRFWQGCDRIGWPFGPCSSCFC